MIGSPTGGHVKLDDLSTYAGTRHQFSDRFYMVPLTNTTSVRIFAEVGGGPDTTYNIYSGSDGGMPGIPQIIQANGRLVNAQKLNSRQTIALVVGNNYNPDTGMSSNPQLWLHTFDDSNFGTFPTMVPITNPNQLGTSGNIEATFAPDADGRIAVAASFEVGTARTRAAYGLYQGASINLTTLAEDPTPDNMRPTALVHVRGVAGYTFIGQAPQLEFEVKDDGSSPTPPSHRQIMTNQFMILGNIDTLGKINFGAADIGTALMPKLALYLGQVDPSRAMTFDPASLTLAINATSINDVPIGSLNGFSDDLLYFAGSTGPNGNELSILFLDVLGRTRAAQKLQTTQGRISIATITPRGLMGGVGGNYHIAWAETLVDPTNNKYDVLWYDQINCQ